MKKYSVALIMLCASSAFADEFVQMSNGMTCWRNRNGQLWGCSGGVDTGDRGFNDIRRGTRYNYINPNQAIDTQTGQPIDTPYRNLNRNRYMMMIRQLQSF